jgi:DNA-directed RNA polymerase subunit alpha
MLQLKFLESVTVSPTQLYSKYSIGPFIKGQGTTIGNVLRRVLLSNLSGLAITGVRITGINHEFSTVPNVEDEVVDILLNIKQIVLKGSIKEPTLVRLSTNNAGIITAANIDLPNNLEVVDPHQYITRFTGNGDLEMEFLIDRGQNYVPSGKLDLTIPEGFLAVDGVFMPVRLVNLFVETPKNNLELESLILEVWTNGSITPTEALSVSAEILEKTFGILKITDTLSIDSSNPELPVPEEKEEYLDNVLIEELELSTRPYNCLKRANVNTLSELLQYSVDDLLELKSFGKNSADEICDNLKKLFDLDLRK